MSHAAFLWYFLSIGYGFFVIIFFRSPTYSMKLAGHIFEFIVLLFQINHFLR